MRGPGPTALLERALMASARARGITIIVESTQAESWESATFSGARHILQARAAATEAIDPWLAQLPEADLPLPGHLVADLTIAAATRNDTAHRFTIEALTVVCD